MTAQRGIRIETSNSPARLLANASLHRAARADADPCFAQIRVSVPC